MSPDGEVIASIVVVGFFPVVMGLAGIHQAIRAQDRRQELGRMSDALEELKGQLGELKAKRNDSGR